MCGARNSTGRRCAIAASASSIAPSVPLHQRGHLVLRPEPQRRQLGDHLPDRGDGLAARARVRVAGQREVLAQVPAVGGGHPIDRPAEDGSHRVQQREAAISRRTRRRKRGESVQDYLISLRSFHPETVRNNERTSLYFRVRFRGPSRQGRGPDFGRGARRDSSPGPALARRRRDAGEGQPGGARRRDHHQRRRSTSSTSRARPSGASATPIRRSASTPTAAP